MDKVHSLSLLADLPVVTIEAIVRFRAIAIKVERERDALLAALEKAVGKEEFERLIKEIRK